MTRMLQLARAFYLPKRPVKGRALLDPSVTRMRVRPTDLDIYLHVNNGSYLQMMDVARIFHLGESGGIAQARRHQWAPVVAASTTKYRRSLRLFDRFEITTRVLGWDERAFYMEHVVARREKLSARGIIAIRFLDKAGNRISTTDVIELVQPGLASPTLPDDVAAWARAMDVAPRVPSAKN